jgi:hypothetical protein
MAFPDIVLKKRKKTFLETAITNVLPHGGSLDMPLRTGHGKRFIAENKERFAMEMQ